MLLEKIVYDPFIRQFLEKIDYEGLKPQTYLVLVPGLSLVIQNIQLANTLPLINNITQQNIPQANAKSKKFANICKWHLRGSMTQMAASVIAIKMFSTPLFSVLFILTTYELIDTLIKSLKNSIILYEFYPNGTIKRLILLCTVVDTPILFLIKADVQEGYLYSVSSSILNKLT